MLKMMNVVHRAVLKVSFGKAGWDAGKMPVLELTTTGRKSGQARKVMLTSPLQVGESLVIVASRGGDDQHPAWFHNLRDNPNVEVNYKGGGTRSMIARIATADERAEMWPKVTARYKNYAGYQSRTQREIPLVLLQPSPPPPNQNEASQ